MRLAPLFAESIRVPHLLGLFKLGTRWDVTVPRPVRSMSRRDDDVRSGTLPDVLAVTVLAAAKAAAGVAGNASA
jgi:hypothetical protein